MANIEDLRDRSVSSGTLKSEDLIPKFLGVLKTYGKDKYELKQGDSIYYESIVAHHVHSHGNEKAKILAVVYTPA